MKAENSASETNLKIIMKTIGERAQAAYRLLADASSERKNSALLAAAKEIRSGSEKIIAANDADMSAAENAGLSKAMLDRLKLKPESVETMAKSLEEIAAFPDPVGKVLAEWTRPNGLIIKRVSIPLGVIGIIYESRPNVTADAGGLCLKSGNAAVLRGGSDSLNSSKAIAECLHAGLVSAGLPADVIQLVPTRDREAVGEMLTMNEYIDVIVPRGGKSLTERILKESRIPTIQHLDGNCHTYIHESADVSMAKEVLLNAKMRRTGICGATESVLIDADATEKLLPVLIEALTSAGCEIRGDEQVRKFGANIALATEEDWGSEYLDAKLSIKTVKDVYEAVEHINRYGSHHTDAIIADDARAAKIFLNRVDSAIVLHNASTQFADGGEFGMGGEIGISTGRLHARGPVGIEQLTTYKYVLHGNGQIRPV